MERATHKCEEESDGWRGPLISVRRRVMGGEGHSKV